MAMTRMMTMTRVGMIQIPCNEFMKVATSMDTVYLPCECGIVHHDVVSLSGILCKMNYRKVELTHVAEEFPH